MTNYSLQTQVVTNSFLVNNKKNLTLPGFSMAGGVFPEG